MQHTKEVLISVGITVAIAVIAVAILGGSSISQTQSGDLLEIESIALKKGLSVDALLSVKVKNIGNSKLTNVKGKLNFGDLDHRFLPEPANVRLSN